MNIIEYIQIGLLVFVVPALIFVLYRIRKNELLRIDTTVIDHLKNAVSEPMQDYEKLSIDKRYVTSFVVGLFLIQIIFTILETCIERAFFYDKHLVSLETRLVYSVIGLAIKMIGLVVSLIGPLLWISWDKKRIQTKAVLIKMTAYVHSTSNPSTSYNNRTAYLVYYDRYKDKLCAKTVQLNKFEKKNGRVHKGEFVLIAVEERNTKIRFVNIFKKSLTSP